MQQKFSRDQIATSIAILFHTIGVVGIVLFQSSLIVECTSVNLLLSFVLLFWAMPEKNMRFIFFTLAAFFVGLFIEILGVNTGLVFGDYSYGTVLGPQLYGVPLLIGLNWFIIVCCCGCFIHQLMEKLIKKLPTEVASPSKWMNTLTIIIDGATLMVAFDWLMEPVALKLGFWKWHGNGDIPFYNYTSWFFVSIVLMALFQFCKFNKRSAFAANLLLIQAMFFLLIRTFSN